MKKICNFVYAFLLLICTINNVSAQSLRSDSLFAIGVDLYKAKEYRAAIPIFSQIDSLDMANRDILPNRTVYGAMWLASCYHRIGKEKQAEKIYPNYKVMPIDRRLTVEIDSLLYEFLKANKNKDFSLAHNIISDCLDLFKKKIGETHLMYSNILSQKANLLISQKQYDKAIEILQQTLKIRYNNLNQFDARYLSILDDIANLYNTVGDDVKCLESLKQQLDIIENKSIPLSDEELVTMKLYNNISFLSERLKNIEDIFIYDNRARKYIQKRYGTDNKKYFEASLKSLTDMTKYWGVLTIRETKYIKQLCNELLPIAEKLYGKTSKEYFQVLYQTVGYYSSNEIFIGQKYYKELLSLSEQMYGDSPDFAIVAHRIGRIYASIDSIDKAYKYTHKAYEILKREKESHYVEYMNSLNNLSYILSLQDSIPQSIILNEEALSISLELFGATSEHYAELLHDNGRLYMAAGEFEKAEEKFRTSIDILRNNNLNGSELYLKALYSLVESKKIIEQYDDALNYVDELVSLSKQRYGDCHINYAQALNLSNCIKDKVTPNLNESIENEQTALRIVKNNLGEDNYTYAYFLSELSLYQLKGGDYSDALKSALQAESIVKNKYGESNSMYSTIMSDLAKVYSAVGSNKRALECYKEVVGIRRKTLGESHPLYAYSLSILSDYYKSCDSISIARTYCEKSLGILDGIGISKTHDAYNDALEIYAGILNQLGEYKLAVEYYIRSVELLLEKYGKKNPKYVDALANLSDIYLTSHIDVPKGMELAKQIVSIRKSLTGEKTLAIRSDYERLSFAAMLMKEKENTYNYAMKSSEITEDILFNNIESMTHAERNSFYSSCVDWYRRQFLYIYGIESEDSCDNSRLSFLYNGALMCKGMLLGVENSKLLQRDINKFRVSWKEIRDRLSENEIAIEFFCIPISERNAYHALVLKKDYQYPHIIYMFSDEGKTLLQKKTEELSRNIWESIVDELSGVVNIYFSPDGELYNIPIESLPYWNGKGLVSDHYNMYRLSSTRELVLYGNKTICKNAAIWGGVKYDTKEDLLIADSRKYRSQERSFNYEPFAIADSLNLRSGAAYLPATRIEAEEIDKTLEQKKITTKLLIDTLATEGAFKDLSGKKTNLLHIATHGFYWTEKEAKYKENLNFLMLNDNQSRYVEDKALTRSGLLLAGANHALMGKKLPDGVDDGILTAKEISQLDLRDLDLVVLSACETGLGEIKGDGVFGLQRGFKKAGANSLLMSLWKVDDTATQLLMTQFYKNLTSGKSKYESLRQAQSYVREYEKEVEVGNDVNSELSNIPELAQNSNSVKKIKKRIRPYQDPKFWAAFILLDAID